MKKLLIAVAAMVVLASAAAAAKTQDDFQLVIVMQTPAEALVEAWCDLPHPEPKKGQIVIWYERDADGNCVPHAKQGK